MRFFTVLVFSLLFNFSSAAQPFTFLNSSLVDTSRYLDIKRSPYLYDQWQSAEISNRSGLKIENVQLNFNGYEQKFEVTQQGKQITIDDNLYDQIVVNVDGVTELFLRGIHYELATELANVIYNGEEVKLIRIFTVRLDETIQDSPGESLVTSRFAESRTYTILYNSKLSNVRLTTRRIGKVLKNKELIKQIVTREKLDVGTESGARRLLSFFEEYEY